jgi:hypothetical protein
MSLTPEQKARAIEFIESGDRLRAIGYLQEILHISAFQSQTLIDSLEQELTATDPNFQKRTNKRAGLGLIGAGIFLLIGLALLGFTTHLFLKNQDFTKRAVPLMGTVTAYDQYESSDDDGSTTTMYTPIFDYDYNGTRYTHTSEMSSSSQSYAIGESIELLIDPEQPEAVLVNSFTGMWLLPLLLGVMGSVFTLVGFFAIRR